MLETIASVNGVVNGIVWGPVGLALLACPNPTAQAENFRPTAGRAALCAACLAASVLFLSGVDTFIYANF